MIYDQALVQPVRILWFRNYQQGWGTADRLGLGGMHAQPVSDRRLRDAGRAGAGHSVRGSGYARPAVGTHLEENFEKNMDKPKHELDLGFK